MALSQKLKVQTHRLAASCIKSCCLPVGLKRALVCLMMPEPTDGKAHIDPHNGFLKNATQKLPSDCDQVGGGKRSCDTDFGSALPIIKVQDGCKCCHDLGTPLQRNVQLTTSTSGTNS
jgi:hypothetical protein